MVEIKKIPTLPLLYIGVGANSSIVFMSLFLSFEYILEYSTVIVRLIFEKIIRTLIIRINKNFIFVSSYRNRHKVLVSMIITFKIGLLHQG